MRVNPYRDLLVWQHAMAVAEDCYRLTRIFPKEGVYGMTSQVRRSAASVPANIAEGNGRENRGEYVQFLRVAQGALKELETHLLLAQRVGIASSPATDNVLKRCAELGKMLRGLIRAIQGLR